jgi:hypothetical protein
MRAKFLPKTQVLFIYFLYIKLMQHEKHEKKLKVERERRTAPMQKTFMSPPWPQNRAFQTTAQATLQPEMTNSSHDIALAATEEEIRLIEASPAPQLSFFQEKSIARKPSLPKAWRPI